MSFLFLNRIRGINTSLSRWKYMRSVVMDGNFSAEHLRMRNPNDDVALSDGQGFMVGERLYKEHLKVALEFKEVRHRPWRGGDTLTLRARLMGIEVRLSRPSRGQSGQRRPA